MASESVRWMLHNVVGHPLMGLLNFMGFEGLGEWVHEVTLPRERVLGVVGEDGRVMGEVVVQSMCLQVEASEEKADELEGALVEILGLELEGGGDEGGGGGGRRGGGGVGSGGVR